MTDPFFGEIRMFAGNFSPRLWTFCDGQLLQIDQHATLFSLLGTVYGGNGRTTMGIPNLKGRSPMGQGTGHGLTPSPQGDVQGTPFVQLDGSKLPSHSHAMQTDLSPSTSSTPGQTEWLGLASSGSGSYVTMYKDPPTIDTGMNATALSASGGGQLHENRQPYLGIHFIICLFGNYPSRN